MMNEQTPVNPWYRQPWFWFLLIFPGMSIIWCTIAITVALNSDNAMVTDNYSREGRGINTELARDDRALELGLQGKLQWQDGKLLLDLDGHEGASNFPYLIVNLFHPTLEQRDRTVQLEPQGDGRYVARTSGNLDGRWYLDLRDPDNDWRLKGEITLPNSESMELAPDTQAVSRSASESREQG